MRREPYAVALCGLMALWGCATEDRWERHRFVAADKALVTGSGAYLVSATPRPTAVEEVGTTGLILAFQLKAGPHTVRVRHWETPHTTQHCMLDFDFQPGKRYRVIKSSLDSKGEVTGGVLFYEKKWGVWLTEHNSSVVLRECK